MEIKKLFGTKDGLRSGRAAMDELERRKMDQFRVNCRLERVDRVLTALSRDWRQPLNQMFTHRGVARMSLLRPGSCNLDRVPKLAVESGGILLWPEELVSYEDPRNGLDVSLDSVRQDLIRPMNEAMSLPCPDCSAPAYAVCDVHDSYGSELMDMGPHQHARFMLLCAECVTVSPLHPDVRPNECCVV